MNYHFKNNNIYWGSVLVADDMRDATKRLNELEDMFAEELKTALITGEYPTKMVEK